MYGSQPRNVETWSNNLWSEHLILYFKKDPLFCTTHIYFLCKKDSQGRVDKHFHNAVHFSKATIQLHNSWYVQNVTEHADSSIAAYIGRRLTKTMASCRPVSQMLTSSIIMSRI